MHQVNISPGWLHLTSSRRDVVDVRGAKSWIAIRELGNSGADVARYLGVIYSCVIRIFVSGPQPDIDDLFRKI